MSVAETVTIPNVQLSLEQLLSVIPQLGPEARTELAKALLETELDDRMAELMHSLAHRPAADDVSDADIVAEVNAVREPEHRSC
jgi:hypothetical protein